jgi:hypothetical protein
VSVWHIYLFALGDESRLLGRTNQPYELPISKLSALAQRGDLVFREPIRITCDGLVIDGYVCLELARQLDRTELLCLEYDLAEAESLKEMLKAHQALKGFNAFQRTVLALDLESEFQEQARSHQQEGGRHKGSSKLTEAGRLGCPIQNCSSRRRVGRQCQESEMAHDGCAPGPNRSLEGWRDQHSPGLALDSIIPRETA